MAVPAERLEHKLEGDALLADYVQEYRPLIERLCRILLGHGSEAEDAAQQTFLLAYQSLLAGTRPHQPRAWLCTIARRECWARADRRRRERTLPETEAVVVELDPAERTVLRAELATINASLEQLPVRQKQAIVLRELAGYSYTQLAAALEVSESAAEALLVRARRSLREARLVLVLLPFPGSLRRLLRIGGGHARTAVGMQAAKAVVVATIVTATAAVAGAEASRPERTARPPVPVAVRAAPAPAHVTKAPRRSGPAPAKPRARPARAAAPKRPAQSAAPAVPSVASAQASTAVDPGPTAASAPAPRAANPAPRTESTPKASKPSPPAPKPKPKPEAAKKPSTTTTPPASPTTNDHAAPPPPPAPTDTTPAPADPPPDELTTPSSGDKGDTRPGNGYGDDNHDHSGKK